MRRWLLLNRVVDLLPVLLQRQLLQRCELVNVPSVLSGNLLGRQLHQRLHVVHELRERLVLGLDRGLVHELPARLERRDQREVGV